MSIGQFTRRKNWVNGNMTPAAVDEDIRNLRQTLGNSNNIGSPVNVMDFGAVGDGKHDDTNAINYVLSKGGEVFIPAGTYLITGTLTLVNNLRIVGAGKYVTTIQFKQSNITTFNYSMFSCATSLSNVSIESLGMLGNRSVQTTAGSDVNSGFAIQLNFGTLTNFTLRDCYIREFGDNASTHGGGVSIIPGPAISDTTLKNLNFLDNHFGPSNDVPGIYVASIYGSSAGSLSGCNISRNRFEGGGIQNCVYILSGTSRPAYNVNVDNNEFVLLEDCDTCVEYNGVIGGSISNNMIRSTSTGLGTGILIRGQGAATAIATSYIVVSGNTFINQNSGDKVGISLVAFDSTGIQNNVVISNNIFVDYGKTSNAAVQILKGSANIVFTGNQIYSPSGTIFHGIDIGEFTDVHISDNLFRNVGVPFTIGGGNPDRNLTISDNEFDTCGVNGSSLIVTTGGTLDLQGVIVYQNRVYNSVAGTVSFVSLNATVPTTNFVYENISDVLENSTGFPSDYVVKVTTGSTNFPTTAQYGDAVFDGGGSFTLTPGDWDISVNLAFFLNGSTIVVSSSNPQIAVTTTSGNSSTGISTADNQAYINNPNSPVTVSFATIPSYRVSITASTTYYLKLYCEYTGGPPQYRCRISARRPK